MPTNENFVQKNFDKIFPEFAPPIMANTINENSFLNYSGIGTTA